MILTKLSASAVDTADPNSAFGCPRKFHFQYVQKLRPPQDSSAELGEAVHKSIEHYLQHKGDTGNALHPMALAAKDIIDEYIPRRKMIEYAFGPSNNLSAPLLTAHGIPFSGRIDLLLPPDSYGRLPWEIVDWKTTSDIARYAKTRGEAARSTQMITYMAWLFLNDAGIDRARGAFVYMQTRGRKAEKVAVDFDRAAVERGWTGVESMVKSCVDIAAENDVTKVEPNLNACNVARGCPFRDRCPRSAVTAVQFFQTLPVAPHAVPTKAHDMSLLDRFRAQAAAASTPAPASAPVGPAPVGNPPAAAPSAPAAPAAPPAATPPERPSAKRLLIGDVTPAAPTPAPTPEEPRKAGRPKGSKNKPKDTDFKLPETRPPTFTPAEDLLPKTPAGRLEKVSAMIADGFIPADTGVKLLQAPSRITRAVVRRGITIPTGQFANVRLDVELEMTGEIDLNELTRRVTEELLRQAEEFQLNPNPPASK